MAKIIDLTQIDLTDDTSEVEELLIVGRNSSLPAGVLPFDDDEIMVIGDFPKNSRVREAIPKFPSSHLSSVKKSKRKAVSAASSNQRQSKKQRFTREVIEISDDETAAEIRADSSMASVGGLLTPRPTPTPAYSAPEPSEPELHAWDVYEDLYHSIPEPEKQLEGVPILPAMKNLWIGSEPMDMRFSPEPRLRDELFYVYRSPRHITNSFPKLRNMKLKWTYDDLPGVVNEIIQQDGITVIASSATEGGADEGIRPVVVDQFNKPGSLVILDRIGQAHQVPLHNGSTGKTYDVNDVQFVPSCSRSLVSSGCDRKICWFKFGFVDEVVSGEDEAPSLAQVDKGETNRPITRSWSVDSANSEILFSRTLPCVPHELRFKPDAYDPVLAIACDDGKLRLHRNFDSDFKVWPIGRERAPAIVWGKGPTSDFLFGAAQRDSKNSAHKCLDPHSSRARVVYDLFEDNDNIALHPHGATLAAMTLADSLNKMHLLDVAREIRQPILSINLEPFLTTHRFANGDSAQDEIKSAEYSPDGIYLALGRTDDTVHVYDSRMMHRGPVHQFSQSFSRKSAGQQNGGEVLGVAKLQWIEGEKSRYGLVSSGTDARVRLWDVLRSSDDSLNGHILAEANFDVNTFNIGTRPGQDYTMILGDCGGTLCAYDKW